VLTDPNTSSPPAPPSAADPPPWPLIGAVVLLAAVRLWAGAAAGLESDEPYYWLWSRHFAAGYYDHPPMVAYWIGASTALLGDSVFAIRLPAILASFAVSGLLYALAMALVADRRVALVAVLWFNAMPMTALVSTTMWPDAPASVFWLVCCLALARLWRSGNPMWWYAFGVSAGLLLLSKYTGFFLLAGCALWIVAARDMRHWLRRPESYAAAGLALAVFVPNVVWNLQHDGGAFAHQFGRLGRESPTNLLFVADYVGTQAGLVSPLIFAFAVAGLGVALVRGWRRQQSGWLLLAFSSLPLLLFMFYHAITHHIEGNWPSAVWPAAILATVAGFGARSLASGLIGRAYRLAPWVGIAIALLFHAQMTAFALPLPVKSDPFARRAGWPEFARDIGALATREQAAFVMTVSWPLAAQLGYFLREPVVFQANERQRYAFQPPFDPAPLARGGLLLADEGPAATDLAGSYFTTVELLGRVERRRGTDTSQVVRVFRVSGYRGGMPL
jgi:4-amino-4-deoxy-L-arabinose transferase-like glycosyltransferase